MRRHGSFLGLKVFTKVGNKVGTKVGNPLIGLLRSNLFLLGLIGASVVLAQPINPTSPPSLESEALRIATIWNDSRNTFNTDALLQIVHPADRENGQAFVDALPRGTTPGNATIRVRDVSKIDNQRIQIRVERAWGGSRPGKSTWRLQASYYQGTLYLRIPGGDLAMPKGVKPVVSSVAGQAASQPLIQTPPPVTGPTAAKPAASAVQDLSSAPTAATAQAQLAPKTQKPVTPELKVAEPALPYNDGKIYESGAQVKTITPPLPKIPETISMTGPAGASRFGDWLRLCEKTAKGSECFLEALLYAPGDKKKFLLIRARPHATGKIAVQFVTPNEIALRPGLRLTVADKPAQQLSFEICRREHCEINFVLDQQQFLSSVDGMKMAAVYETFAGTKPQTSPATQKTETTRNPQAPQSNPATVTAQFAVSFLDFFRAIETPTPEKQAPEKP